MAKCVICNRRQSEIGANTCMICAIDDFYKGRQKMYICVDFDGTMVDHQYPKIGWAVPGAIEWCKTFQHHGAEIILWTMRSGKELEEARLYMENNGIKLFGVNENPTQKVWTNSPKAYGHMYIDDAAIGCPMLRIEGFQRLCVDWTDVASQVMRQLKPVK
jgi:hypothetical protein